MKLFIIILGLLSAEWSIGQSLPQAMQLFNQNKRAEAKKAFEAIPQTSVDYQEALLGLTLLELDNGHYPESFAYFQRFYQQSPNAYPYVYAIWSKLISANSDKQKLEGFLQKLSSDAKCPITLKAMALASLADRQLSANNLKQSRETYSGIGDVKNWASVGVFDNVSGSGYGKDFGILAHPEPNYLFKNENNAPVQWFNIPDARMDRWLDFEYHYGVNNSIIYAQTFLSSETDRNVQMLLGVSGSVKLWVNDFEVFAEPEERNTDLDVYHVDAKLQKGNNRILIQIGASEINRSNFMLRIADDKGNLLNNLPSSPVYSTYIKATPYTVVQHPLFAEAFFEEKLKNKTASFFDKIMLAEVYNRNDKRYQSRKISKQLKQEVPENTIISEILIEAYERDKNKTDLTREEEFIKTNDPESLYGLILRFNDAYGKEDFDEAKKLLDQRIALYGENAQTTSNLIGILSKKKDYEKLLIEAEKAYKTYPDNSQFTLLKYNIEQGRQKDVYSANLILEKYVKSNYHADFLETIAENKMKLGKKDEGMKILLRMIDDFPHATMRYATIADKYSNDRNYDKAIVWQQKAIDRAPYIGGFYLTKGTIYETSGKKTEAIEAYKKAVQYAPNNYEARKKLRLLQGKKDLFDHFKENNVLALFKAAPKQEAYPNSGSIYLLKEKQQIIYPENGASEERDEFLIKILNQSGISDWKEVSIPFNEYAQRLIFDKIELFKKDGSKIQAENNENQVVFSSLEVGDAIHISYKLESSSYGKLSEHFWQDFTFNDASPILQARFSLLVPTDKKFNFKMYNTELKPSITAVDDNKYQLYTWEKVNSTALESEPYMPPAADVQQRISVSSIPDWNYVANWYSDLSNIKIKADFQIKEKAKELFADKEQLSATEKAKVIYNYIEENFSYSNVPFLHSALTPQRASRTLDSRLGDCKDLAVLFTSLAKEVGLDANLVLVDTRNDGDTYVDIPKINFNHCIAQLRADGNTYLLELTDNMLSFGALPYNVVNANGLYIPKDGAQTNNAGLMKLNFANRKLNTINRTSTVNFEGKKMSVVRNSQRVGEEASRTRSFYKHLSEEDKKKNLLRSLGNEFSNPIELKSFNLVNLENLADTVQYNYAFTLDKYLSEIAGLQICKLPWNDDFKSLEVVSLEKRNFPINLWSFSSTPYDKEVMTIFYPAGKKLVEIPQNVQLSCEGIEYRLVYEIKADRLIVTRELKYTKDYVAPKDYAAFKDVFTKLAEADKKEIAFK